MKYNEGSILYIYERRNPRVTCKLVVLKKEYQGDQDISYHGSPEYETFIECVDPITNKVETYGSEHYSWTNALDYIKTLHEKLDKIREVAFTIN